MSRRITPPPPQITSVRVPHKLEAMGCLPCLPLHRNNKNRRGKEFCPSPMKHSGDSGRRIRWDGRTVAPCAAAGALGVASAIRLTEGLGAATGARRG